MAETPEPSRLTRRALLKRGAVVGAALPTVGLAAGWKYGGTHAADPPSF